MADGSIIIDTSLDTSGVEKDLSKLNNSVNKSVSGLSSEFKSANMSLTESFQEGTEEAKKSIGGLSEDAKVKLSGMAETAKKAVIGGFATIGATILGSSGTIIKLGDDYQKASNILQTQTGATAQEMDKLNAAMTGVYGNNFGESMQDVAQSMAQVRTYLQGTEEDIQGVTQNAIAFRDTFGVEVPESMRSVSTLMNQFGITSEQAFNLLAQGQQQNLNFSDELYDSVNEYSVQFKKLGLDAEDMFNIFNDGAIDGAFNLDKIGDAVKEFSIRAIDGSKTTTDGFTALGLNADDMAKKFATGGDTAKKAFIQVTQAIANMNDPVKQSTVGVDLFGTMWEDLGPKVVTQLGNIGDSFNKTIDTMKQINQIKYNSFGEALSGIGRQIQTEVLLPVAKNVLPSLNDMANELKTAFSSKEMQSSIKSLSDGLSEFIKGAASAAKDVLPKLIEVLGWILANANNIAAGIIGIGTAMAVFKAATLITTFVKAISEAKKATEGLSTAQALLNIVMDSNPIGFIIAAIAGLIAAVVYLWNTNEGFRNAIIGTWNAIKEAAGVVWGAIVTFFTDTIPNAFMDLGKFFTETIPNFFSDLWTSITAFCSDGWNSIVTFFTDTIPTFIASIGQWFMQLPYNIGYALGYVIATIIKWGADTWNYLVTNVPIWISSIGTWFSNLPGAIWNWLVNVINDIANWGSSVYNSATTWIGNTIDSIISWFSQLPARIWSWLTTTISNIGSWGANMASSGIEAAKNLVNSIIDTVSSLPSKMFEIGSNIVKGVWNGITGMVGWLHDKVGGFFSGIVDGAKEALGIHSPSRVFRDQVGKYMAQGVGVGFEDESKDVQDNMKNNLSELTAKMQATVDYETTRSTVNVASKNQQVVANSSGTNGFEKNTPTKQEVHVHAHLDVDGKEFTQTVVAPNQEVLDDYYKGR